MKILRILAAQMSPDAPFFSYLRDAPFVADTLNMQSQLMFSSVDQTWETPLDFFNSLNAEFLFTLDPACVESTAKCKRFFTPEQNGLVQDWQGETCFVNPPYGREIGKWVAKCANEAKKPGTKVVMLIPARTDATYFHEHIYKKVSEIRFVKGRLKFGSAKNGAPFPSMVVIF